MDLNAVRERINAIDDQIVDLFVERMKASADVASAKAARNLKFISISCIRQFSISARAIRQGF